MTKLSLVPGFLAGALCASILIPAFSAPPSSIEQDPEEGGADLAAMMERAKQYTEPGEHHRLLERFLGQWDTETRIFMGAQALAPSKGTSEFSWLMDGRWLQQRGSGSMMGRPLETFWIMGYDNFKMSYVATSVHTMDTSMIRSEGDLDPGGDVLIMYGTLDEYLTGEHDKMVKSVYRFLSEDEIVMELHDLPIGEKNTKVVEVRFKRSR